MKIYRYCRGHCIRVAALRGVLWRHNHLRSYSAAVHANSTHRRALSVWIVRDGEWAADRLKILWYIS